MPLRTSRHNATWQMGGATVDIAKTRADIAKLQAETMRLHDAGQTTDKMLQRWTSVLGAGALLAVGTGLVAVALQIAKMFLNGL
jgi:hypothetical protein